MRTIDLGAVGAASEIVAAAQRGEPALIVHAGAPVAKLQPLADSPVDDMLARRDARAQPETGPADWRAARDEGRP